MSPTPDIRPITTRGAGNAAATRVFAPLASFLLAAVLLTAGGARQACAQSVYEVRRAAITSRQTETRQVIESIDERIQASLRRLDRTDREYSDMFRTYEELVILISLQNRKVEEIRNKIRQSEQEMALIGRNLDALRQEHDLLLQEYRRSLAYLYKNGKTHSIALLLTAPSINNMLIRSVYLRKYDRHRRLQADEIMANQRELGSTLEAFTRAKGENAELLQELETETRTLSTREATLETQIQRLQRDREALEEQVETFRREQSALQNTLSELSRQEDDLREAELERQRIVALAREIGTTRPVDAGDGVASVSSGNAAVLTRPEREMDAAELERFQQRFGSQKGALPWPVENGVVASRFGLVEHPVFKTRIENPGVEISAPPGSPVRSVGDGVVFGVQPITGYGDVILVNHGRYKTAYGNLSRVLAGKGQVVRAGETIGRSGTRESTRGEVILFVVRDGNQNVDPEQWLRPPVR